MSARDTRFHEEREMQKHHRAALVSQIMKDVQNEKALWESQRDAQLASLRALQAHSLSLLGMGQKEAVYHESVDRLEAHEQSRRWLDLTHATLARHEVALSKAAMERIEKPESKRQEMAAYRREVTKAAAEATRRMAASASTAAGVVAGDDESSKEGMSDMIYMPSRSGRARGGAGCGARTYVLNSTSSSAAGTLANGGGDMPDRNSALGLSHFVGHDITSVASGMRGGGEATGRVTTGRVGQQQLLPRTTVAAAHSSAVKSHRPGDTNQAGSGALGTTKRGASTSQKGAPPMPLTSSTLSPLYGPSGSDASLILANSRLSREALNETISSCIPRSSNTLKTSSATQATPHAWDADESFSAAVFPRVPQSGSLSTSTVIRAPVLVVTDTESRRHATEESAIAAGFGEGAAQALVDGWSGGVEQSRETDERREAAGFNSLASSWLARMRGGKSGKSLAINHDAERAMAHLSHMQEAVKGAKITSAQLRTATPWWPPTARNRADDVSQEAAAEDPHATAAINTLLPFMNDPTRSTAAAAATAPTTATSKAQPRTSGSGVFASTFTSNAPPSRPSHSASSSGGSTKERFGHSQLHGGFEEGLGGVVSPPFNAYSRMTAALARD